MTTNSQQEKNRGLTQNRITQRYLFIFRVVLSLLCVTFAAQAARAFNSTFVGSRTLADVTVSLPDNATASNGTVVTIPITTTDLTGRGVIAYNFDFRFDPSVLQLTTTPVQTAGTISSGCFIESNSPMTGQLLVGCDVTTALSGAGTLLNLQFNVIGAPNSTTALTLQSFVFNGGTPTVEPNNGTFRVTGPTAAAVGVGGRVTTTQGNGIRGVVVTMTDSNGTVRTIMTNESGYYRFDDVEAGSTYVISVRAKRYSFSQATQVMSINEETTDVNFIGATSKKRFVD